MRAARARGRARDWRAAEEKEKSFSGLSCLSCLSCPKTPNSSSASVVSASSLPARDMCSSSASGASRARATPTMSATVSDRSASRSAVSAAFSNAAAAATCAPCVSRSRASLRIARTSAFTSPAAMAASRSRWWKYEAFSWSFFSRKNAASVARAAGTAVEGVLRRLRAHQDVADVPRVLHRQLLGFHVIVRVYVDPELERLLLGQGVVPVPVVRRGQAMKIHERVGTARGQRADAQGVFGVVIPRLPHRDLSGFPREITRGRRQGVHGEPGQVRRSLCEIRL